MKNKNFSKRIKKKKKNQCSYCKEVFNKDELASICLICNHELYCNEEEEEAGLDKLVEENTMLINIVLGNDNYKDAFKEWCRKNLSEEYLKKQKNSEERKHLEKFKRVLRFVSNVSISIYI